MPVLDDEAGIYGYTDENRHMVEAFRRGEMPSETFADGVGVMEMLIGLYRSAERGRPVFFPDAALEGYVPVVARGVVIEPSLARDRHRQLRHCGRAKRSNPAPPARTGLPRPEMLPAKTERAYCYVVSRPSLRFTRARRGACQR